MTNDCSAGCDRPAMYCARCLALANGGKLAKAHLVELFNAGYALGRHDTVEGQYTDIHEDDAKTYHKEVVDGLLEELKEKPNE